ncbi:MAG: type III pantothenate kinase [Gammaproteobacteria bacterium]
MILLLDVGNSRVKAGLRVDGGVRFLGASAYRETGLGAALDGLDLPRADRGIAAVVGGAEVAAALEAWAEGRRLPLERIWPCAEAAGVRCAYPEPRRLGADRWAALVGARARTAGPCLVVDAGSAITVDAMAAGGRHLGGYILPGIALMVGSLWSGTGDLAGFSAASEAAAAGDAFPVDTRPAIEEAALLAAAGLVAEAGRRVPGEIPPKVFLTGGGAQGLARLLESAEEVPHLVLEGLAQLASE